MTDSSPANNNLRRPARADNADELEWDRLQALFHLLAEASTEERERVLNDELLAARLRKRVSELLQASDAVRAVSRELAGQSPESDLPDKHTPATAQRTIGPYTVIGNLGSGAPESSIWSAGRWPESNSARR